jgi:hypothetical protein
VSHHHEVIMSATRTSRIPARTVVPDRLDLRDRPYIPPVGTPPRAILAGPALPVLDQGASNACTGFALATVVHALLKRRDGARAAQVSPWMLYSMARRYDEFPGYTADEGSSLRGAMKGWYKHGACRAALWRTPDMPPAAATATKDWWLDAARRPLGAYLRVDHRSVTDMHVALNETGILYASAICHAGWNEGFAPAHARTRSVTPKVTPPADTWRIPHRPAEASDGGHAFAIVGYTREGFLVHNSWGDRWGSGGRAILTYEDWLDHAMDCWAVQLGVETAQHTAVAGAITLRVEAGRVALATDATLRAREISPFIVNMENNGRLSNSGQFRTQPGDIDALMTVHLAEARRRWSLAPGTPVDVAIYAHGGLVGEDAAAATAARWIPALYERRVFPIFLMWETDLFSTIRNRLSDLVTGQPRPTAGIGDLMRKFWNTRVERLLVGPGSFLWEEMKQNAERMSAESASGCALLFDALARAEASFGAPLRLHLIGHSAGSIAHAWIIDRWCRAGRRFDSVSFMAPAITTALFTSHVLPWVERGAAEASAGGGVRRYVQYHLTDHAEQHDDTCRAILLYTRSLLYLVSHSFEGGRETPLLGMERYHAALARLHALPNTSAVVAPSGESGSTTHGGFDDDPATMRHLLSRLSS